MSVHQRLRKIENAIRSARLGYVGHDLAAEMRAMERYLDGGPVPEEPPCPSYDDPERHFHRYRTVICVLMRSKGDLVDGEYLPGLSDIEKRIVDGYLRALAMLTNPPDPV
jgi:hypothetical protein